MRSPPFEVLLRGMPKTMYTIIFTLILFYTIPALSAASLISISPAVIDVSGTAQDMMPQTLTVTNLGNYKMLVYTFVNNLNKNSGLEPFIDPNQADYTVSAANWIKISRGVIPILPHERKTINFEINVSPLAKPDHYHTLLRFAEGTTRAEAESKLNIAPSTIVNIEIGDRSSERIQLEQFRPRERLAAHWPIILTYRIKQSHSIVSDLSGEIRFYNRWGKKIDTIIIPSDATSADGSIRWANNHHLGRYQAILDLEYGKNYPHRIEETTYGWIFPWPKLLIIFIIGVLLIYISGRKRHKKFIILIFFLPMLFFINPLIASAANEPLNISLTPAIFQMTLSPGEKWNSQLKITNNNLYPITVYASIVDVSTIAKDGGSLITPIMDDSNPPNSPVEWLTIPQEPIVIQKWQSILLPIKLTIKKPTIPGGYYAAILIDAKPFKKNDQATVQISNYLSSLFFLRVAGPAKEQIKIKEFKTEKKVSQPSDIKFLVQLENTGQVHLRPRWSIAIYDMWGKKRDTIIFEDEKLITPSAVQRSTQPWKNSHPYFTFGRYTAVLNINAGRGEQFETKKINFWAFSVPTLIAIFGYITIILYILRLWITYPPDKV